MNKTAIDKLSEDELREYLSKLPIDQIPKGNSRFKCKKHNRILPYGDIVSGCYFCIMDEANQKNKGEKDMEGKW